MNKTTVHTLYLAWQWSKTWGVDLQRLTAKTPEHDHPAPQILPWEGSHWRNRAGVVGAVLAEPWERVQPRPKDSAARFQGVVRPRVTQEDPLITYLVHHRDKTQESISSQQFHRETRHADKSNRRPGKGAMIGSRVPNAEDIEHALCLLMNFSLLWFV